MGKILLPNLLCASILVSSLALFSSIRGCNSQPILFTFGDSTYDVGNKHYLSSSDVPADIWPYGISVDRPSGRWSDGGILPDFIADFLEIPRVPPILNEKANFSNGASFAVADATVLGSSSETMTLTDQVMKFSEHKNKWAGQKLAKAVVIITIGSDDYLNYFKLYPNASSGDQRAFVDNVIDGVKAGLVGLYELGARKFAVQNLAPLGCFLIVKQEYETGDECVPQLNRLAELHNKFLREALVRLAKQYKAFQYNYFDFFGSTMRRLKDADAYRLYPAKKACCGIGSHHAFGCAYKTVHSNVCSNQRAALYYDGRHNAQKTNEAMAHLFFGADKTVVRPMNLRELNAYPVGLSMLED